MNILLGVTGSVAASLTPKMISEFSKHGDVRVVATKSALQFFSAEKSTSDIHVSSVNPGHVYTDRADRTPWRNGDRILHVDLKNWADVYVVAPLTANTMASFATGMSNNLVTTIFRCWPVLDKPVILAPAMNSDMWNHPITQSQYKTITGMGHLVKFVSPVSKKLACGDEGIGAMADVTHIVTNVIHTVNTKWHPRY